MTAHFKEPLLIEKGEMQYLFDHNGKKYLDLFGGIVTVSVGHCHPRVNQALIDQAQKLWHTTQIYWYEGIHKYAKQLADTLPEGLDQGKTYMIQGYGPYWQPFSASLGTIKCYNNQSLFLVYFVNSGSEANDLAMMLARLHSGNWNIIALQNAYHGASPYARQLTSHVSS